MMSPEDQIVKKPQPTDTFAPSILLPDGRTITPSGLTWLLAFAIAGCKWAEDALEELKKNYRDEQARLWAGSGI